MLLKDLCDIKQNIVSLDLFLRDPESLRFICEILIGKNSFKKIDVITGLRSSYSNGDLGYIEVDFNLKSSKDYFKIDYSKIPKDLLIASVWDFHLYEHLNGIDCIADLTIPILLAKSIFANTTYLT